MRLLRRLLAGSRLMNVLLDLKRNSKIEDKRNKVKLDGIFFANLLH